MTLKRHAWRPRSSFAGSNPPRRARQVVPHLAKPRRVAQITRVRRVRWTLISRKSSRLPAGAFFLLATLSNLRRRGVVGSGQIAIPLDQHVLTCLVVVFASSHKNMLGAGGELERIAAPNDDIAFAPSLK